MNPLTHPSDTPGCTRHRVLTEFMRQPGTWISGGELSRLLSVSRNAVWRAVRQLADGGYVIESVTGRGYRLMPSGDALIDVYLRHVSQAGIEV